MQGILILLFHASVEAGTNNTTVRLLHPYKLESYIFNNHKICYCTHEIESKIVFVKGAFNKMKIFRQQIGLKFKEETSKVLHLELSIYGVENCTFRKVDRKYVGSFKCCAGEEWRRSGGRIV
jgi:hypothetical protein